MTGRVARTFAGITLSVVLPAGIAFLFAEHECIAQPARTGQGGATPVAFEVASVKKINLWAVDPLFRVEHGNLTCRMGLTYLIAWAYNVPFAQVKAPEWATADAAAAIEAKASSPVGDDQVRLMLRTLLADRYALKVHHENKETTIAALTVDKGRLSLNASTSGGPWRLTFDPIRLRETFTGITMAELTEFLAQFFRGAVDRTGLTGRYDFELDFRPFASSEEPRAINRLQSRMDALVQVGLKIQAVKIPLEFVVVDNLERAPLEN